jgi:protein-disulfide isomerase
MLTIRLNTMARPHIHRRWVRALFPAAVLAFLLCGAQGRSDAQAAPPAPTSVLDNSALHPPAGANVAIVEFSDPECPACAKANPLLKEAAAKYKIPWVRHDLIIQSHPWSMPAAVYARWFEQKGSGLGDAYRDAVFANQPSIYNVKVLDQFTQDFARSHNLAIPFALDPQNKLTEAAKADSELSRRTGIMHTPTIFIVTAHSKGAPFIEVQNADKDLYRTIDQALADTRAAATVAAPHKVAKK